VCARSSEKLKLDALGFRKIVEPQCAGGFMTPVGGGPGIRRNAHQQWKGIETEFILERAPPMKSSLTPEAHDCS
jgi:hypothetical protein